VSGEVRLACPKVFKISEKHYLGHSSTKMNHKQSFNPITTRKFHPGKHRVSLIVNGTELGVLDFQLIDRRNSR